MIDESSLAKSPDLGKILDLFNAQTSSVNTLWNIFIGVNLAIIGFLYKDTHMGGDWKIKLGFTAGIFFFAFANRMAILRSQKILFTITEFLRSLDPHNASSVRPILLAHEAVNPRQMSLWHWIFTIMVALVIWSPEIQKILQRS
jgi:hypothetical protein